jgi:hypothetical protein
MVDGGYLGFAGGDKNPEDRRDERMANITRRYLNEDQSMPGFDDGGTWHNATKHGNYFGIGGGLGGESTGGGVPETPATATTPLPSGDIAGIISAMYRSDLADGNTDLSYADYAALPSVVAEAAYTLKLNDESSSGSDGPDHFYEKIAFEAAEAEKTRRDARQIANVDQQRLQQEALAQYRKDITGADTDRKTEANTAMGTAQDTFIRGLPQMTPGQNLLYAPSYGYRTVMNTKGPTYEAPNVPGTVFPENWG